MYYIYKWYIQYNIYTSSVQYVPFQDIKNASTVVSDEPEYQPAYKVLVVVVAGGSERTLSASGDIEHKII